MTRCLIKEVVSLVLALQKYRGNQSDVLKSSLGLKVIRSIGGVFCILMEPLDITKAGHFVRGQLKSECPDSFRVKHTRARDPPFITSAAECGACLV